MSVPEADDQLKMSRSSAERGNKQVLELVPSTRFKNMCDLTQSLSKKNRHIRQVLCLISTSKGRAEHWYASTFVILAGGKKALKVKVVPTQL